MKGVTMAETPPTSVPAALNNALGAILNTRAAVKKAAGTVYNPPQDQTSHPAGLSGAPAAGA